MAATEPPSAAFPMKAFRTPRLLLRRRQGSDRAPFAPLNVDREVMRRFPGVPDPPTRAWLAWALAEVLPPMRSTLLREGLALAPADGEVTSRLLESFAATEAAAASAELGAWFARPPVEGPGYLRAQYQTAILSGLARPGAPRPTSLPTIFRHLPPESAPVLEAAAAAARNHGCPLPPTECQRLAPRLTKGGTTPEESERAEGSRRRRMPSEQASGQPARARGGAMSSF